MKKYVLLMTLFFSSAFAQDDNIKYVNYPSSWKTQNNTYLRGDFLYWSAKEAGLFYAVEGVKIDGNKPYPLGEMRKITPHFKPGFRLNLGYKLSHDSWDTNLIWTRYHSSSRDEVNSRMLPLWAQGLREYFNHHPIDILDYAYVNWKLRMNILDYELARGFLESKHISNRLFIGLRGTRIQQSLSMNFRGFSYEHQDGIGIHDVNPKADLLGLGIRTGFDTKLYFVKNFGLYMNGSLALVYSHFNASLRDVFTQLGVLRDGILPHDVMLDVKDKFYDSITTSQLALGLSYDTFFSNNNYHVSLQAGWEQNAFYGINKFNHFMNLYRQGDYYQESQSLYLQGLCINVRFDF